MVPLLLGSLNSKSNLLHNAIKIIGFFMLVSGGVVMTLSMPLWVVIIAIIDGLIIFIFGVGGKTNRFSGRPIWDEHNSTTGRGVLIPHAPVWTDDPGGGGLGDLAIGIIAIPLIVIDFIAIGLAITGLIVHAFTWKLW